MSSTKSQVAAAANIPNLSSGQQQKEYNTEEQLGRQNSFGLNRRSNMKGKHLTRSHAMRESTSPPRTPTPRASESSSQMSPNGYQQQQHIDAKEGNNNNNSNINKLQTQSSATQGNSPTMENTSAIIVTSQTKQQQQQQHTNVSLCNEAEFPKLSPPKSKGNNGVGGGGSINEAHNKSVNNINVSAGNMSKNYNQSRQQRKLSEGKGANDALNTLFLEDTQQSRPICNSPMNYQLHSNDGNSPQQQQTFVVHDKENNSSNNNNNQRRINNISESHSSNNNNNTSIGCNKKPNDDATGVNETHNKSSNNMNTGTGNANKNYNQSRQHKKPRAGKDLQDALSALFIDESQSTPNCSSPMNYQSHSSDGNSQQQSFVAYDKENNSNNNNGNSGNYNQRRNNNNNALDVYNNNISSNKNNNNSSIATCSNKNANDDITCITETHNKSTNNMSAISGSANKNYNQSRPQRKLSDALNSIYIDDTQSTSICNSPMNYQLLPNEATSSQQQQQSFIAYDKENRCPRNDSQNSMNSGDEQHYETQHHQQQHQQQQHHRSSGGGVGSGKKHRTNSNSKGSKTRLKNMGGNNNNSGGGGVAAGSIAAGSIEGGSLNSSNNTSGFISRVFTNSENSNEQYTDHGGTDLLSFFKETLNKNVKDRQFLLKVEKDLIEFVQEGNRGEIRFPQASSYNRMLIHRTAAFFGMDHNVDTETQQCVIVAPTKNTRIPELRFKTLVINNRDDSRKSILKRDTHSFDEARQSSYLCPERGGMLDRKAKSFEEREEDYDRARSRIFNRSQNEACMSASGSTEDDNNYISWTSSVEQQQFTRGRPNGKVLKIQNSPDGRNSGNVAQKPNNNFGNYVGPNQGGTPLIRGESTSSPKGMGVNSGNGTRYFSKQDSAGSSNTSWRLSPSSSGYKTQTQSIRSDSVTPSPTGGYGSDELHMPDNSSAIANREINEVASSLPSGLVWAVTDISNVPKGSILINPQTLQPILNADGSVYHYDPSNMPPAQAMTGGNAASNGGVYHTSQNKACLQQHTGHNVIKKQQKGQQIQPQQQQSPSQQQHNKLESATTGGGGCETVSESSTQTINTGDELSASANLGDVNYPEGDSCNQDEIEECDNSTNDCLSVTTTTSAKNYDRIEVQKFKNQATSPNIPLNEKEESVKTEHSIQTPVNVSPTQQSQVQQCPTAQQPQPQNRETPHSSRSTPFSNSDTLTKRSSDESRAISWTQSYQAPDGSTVFHTTSTPNNTGTNPYCTTTTYQQGPDGSIYAVPQGMIYAYPPPVDGEFQGYFMPVFDPSQQRTDGTGLLQPGAPAIYPAGGAATMVPVATYPTTPFATTNGPPIYPGQVLYSGEQFQPAGASLSTTAPSSATTQLQQIPMTTYPIGYPYPYNGYWGQTMAYYVPQQAVPATTLLTAPPPSAPGNGSHVAGGVSNNGSNGGISTAGPSNNSSNTTNNLSGHVGNGNTQNASHSNSSIATGYQSHVHTIGGSGNSVVGSSHTGGTTYYGTGRIKRPNPPHFSSSGNSGAHQVLTAASLPNGVATATYQLGHAVPTITLAAAAPPQPATGVPASTDLGGSSGAPTTTTMYALPQHATIFPANVFPYAASAAAPHITSQPATNMASQTAIIPTPGNPQNHGVGGIGGQENSTAGKIHNAHHSNTVITHFYTTTHHHAPHPSIHSGGHPIHAPGSSAIPIVDPASITGNVTPITPGVNATYTARGGGGVTAAGTSQSAPSTPHSISSSNIHQSQRISTVFSTPPILNSNGGNYNSSNSTPQYYGNTESSHQSLTGNAGGANSSNSSHNSYVSSTYEKRNNLNSASGKKSHSYQSASLSRQNSTSGGGYNANGKPSPLLINANGNNNDLRASPSSSSTNSRPHSIKRGGGTGGVSIVGSVVNDKPQTPLLSGTNNFVGSANNQNASNNSYQVGPNSDVGTSSIPIVNVSKPPIRLNAAAAAFRQKGATGTSVVGSVVEYRRNPTSQRNSPGTNASSNDNSNNNSPNSIHNSSNAATPLATGCYAPSYIISAQNNPSDPTLQHPPSLYITAAPARGPSHIPPHLQSAAAPGAAVPAAAAAATASVPAQTATAVLGGAAAAAAAADVANAAAVAAAAATVAHHHHHQPLLGTYNPGTSGLYFKYGHTYFAHPSVALQNSRRSPSTDLRPPIPQMAGMYPTVNMMIPAQPRHPGRHPNPNYKGTRPR